MWPADNEHGLVPPPAAPRSSALDTPRPLPPPAELPAIHSLNVTNSSRFHLGPKNITITQNNVVRGRLLCLELVSPHQARRLRCSVAVFVCWALVVAAGLAVCLLYLTINKQYRLDIGKRNTADLPLWQYLCSAVKSTTRAERLSCAVALLLVFVCNALIIYFTMFPKKPTPPVVSEVTWLVPREQWLAKPYDYKEPLEHPPAPLVVVQHTVSDECADFITCAAEMRFLQDMYLNSKEYGYDIPYNFVIGNDGRVYEGRGWGVVGAHTKGYNLCSIGIAFMGDYRTEEEGRVGGTQVTATQLNRTLRLLGRGVRGGHLHARHAVAGARDLTRTASPGQRLQDALQRLQHYDHQHQFRNKNCTEINAMFSSDGSGHWTPYSVV